MNLKDGMRVFVALIVTGALLLGGCAAFSEKPSTDKERTSTSITAKGARIDAESVINAADEAGCDMKAITYAEGKRTSRISVYCGGAMKLPMP